MGEGRGHGGGRGGGEGKGSGGGQLVELPAQTLGVGVEGAQDAQGASLP